jgi:heptaprenyl diphosphate synthase
MAVELLGERILDAGALTDPCLYAVSQAGKRLRSRLVLEASRAGADGDPNLDAAAWVGGLCREEARVRIHAAARAVELLHVATLAHDDVIDDGQLRRGQASLDRRHGGFAAAHGGAWLFGTAVELAAECGEEAVRLLAGAACELCDGEMLETQDLYNTGRSEERCLAAIAGKTASLFSLSARLGGMVGGAPAGVCSELGRYGQLLGMAFQLADDLLDMIADGDTGKGHGEDLRHGVYTLPVIYAIEADRSLHGALAGELEEEEVELLIGRVHETGGFERARAICADYREAARAVASELGMAPLESFVDRALEGLVRVQAP